MKSNARHCFHNDVIPICNVATELGGIQRGVSHFAFLSHVNRIFFWNLGGWYGQVDTHCASLLLSRPNKQTPYSTVDYVVLSLDFARDLKSRSKFCICLERFLSFFLFYIVFLEFQFDAENSLVCGAIRCICDASKTLKLNRNRHG